MASWIVHLRVADRLLDRLPGISPQHFLVGNIGPDCGRVTDTPGEYDPPNRITHYSPGGRKRDCQPWRFRDEYLPDQDPARYSFYLGYYVHLQVDRFWHEWIFLPIEAANAAYFAEDPARVFVMKQDWYDQDARFLRDHPDFRAFRMLCAVQEFPNVYLDFYPRTPLPGRSAILRSSMPPPAGIWSGNTGMSIRPPWTASYRTQQKKFSGPCSGMAW